MRPDAIANLAAWWRSIGDGVTLSGGNVQTWIDQSGGGHTITATNAPAWLEDAGDGAPAISFDAHDDEFAPLSGLLSTAAPWSIAMMVQVRQDANGVFSGCAPFGMSNASTAAAIQLLIDTYLQNLAELVYYDASGQGIARAQRPRVAERVWLPILIRYPNDGTIKLRIGEDEADVSLTTGGANGANLVTIGGAHLEGVYRGAFGGLIREAAVYSRSISDADWKALLNWLSGSGGGSGDDSAPVISNVTPTPGTLITPTTRLGCDVTDDSGAFRRVYLLARFMATGAVEVIHDGDNFTGFYVAGSTRTAIANGFRYSVLRRGGWPSSPTLTVDAIDPSGNEA